MAWHQRPLDLDGLRRHQRALSMDLRELLARTVAPQYALSTSELHGFVAPLEHRVLNVLKMLLRHGPEALLPALPLPPRTAAAGVNRLHHAARWRTMLHVLTVCEATVAAVCVVDDPGQRADQVDLAIERVAELLQWVAELRLQEL